MNKLQRANAELLFYAGKDQPKAVKARYKPKEYLQPEWLTQYFVDRDNVLLGDLFTCEETKQEIINKYEK